MDYTGLLARTEPKPELQRAEGIPGLGLKTLTVAGYVRQSEEELRQGLNGTDEQAKKIREFAQAHGWNVIHMYEDISEPSDNLGRPAFLDMLAHPGFDVLLVAATDRITRRKKDLDFLMALLDKCGVTCVAATWTWDYLSQYMRHCYRTKGCKVYACLDAEA